LPSNDIAEPLKDLLVKRSVMGEINEVALNQGLIEKFIAEVVALNGIATVTLRDSNMSTMVVAIGNQIALSRITKSMECKSTVADWKHIVDEEEFGKLLDVGVSVSAFS
jgi:hypothetical protein